MSGGTHRPSTGFSPTNASSVDTGRGPEASDLKAIIRACRDACVRVLHVLAASIQFWVAQMP